MRLISLLFLVFISTRLQGQNVPFNPETKQIIYDSVYEVSGTKDQLYTKAKVWISDIFKSSLRVIDADDKETGMIICKGRVDYNTIETQVTRRKFDEKKVYGFARFTIKVFVKDNKYRVVVEDINIPYVDTPERLIDNLGEMPWSMFYTVSVGQKYNVNKVNEAAKKRTYDTRNATIHNSISNIIESLYSSMDRKSDFDF